MTSTARSVTGRKIKFAIVGCGRISKNHLHALRQHTEASELVAVCDANEAAVQAMAAETGARPFSSLEAMLAGSEADVIVLATPSGLHAAQAIQAAEAKRHIVTEKPMATRWEDGKKMIAAATDAGVRLFVVKQNRTNRTLALLKQAIEQERFGRIYLVNINVFWTRPQSYYTDAPWRGTWEMDGGAFMNQASHYVDLLDWLIGPVESVQAYTATLGRSIETEDTGVASIRWRSGTVGSMNVTMLTYPRNLEASITVLGEKGTVRIGGTAVNEIQAWEFQDEQPDDKTIQEASRETTANLGVGHVSYYENVIRTLRGEADPQTDGSEGLRSLELLTAIYTASREGRRVSLPLE